MNQNKLIVRILQCALVAAIVTFAAACAPRGEWFSAPHTHSESVLIFRSQTADVVVMRSDLIEWLSERPWKLPNLSPWPNAYERARALPDGENAFDLENLDFPGAKWWQMGVSDLASQGRAQFVVNKKPLEGVWVREVTRENITLKEIRSSDDVLLLECCQEISW